MKHMWRERRIKGALTSTVAATVLVTVAPVAIAAPQEAEYRASQAAPSSIPDRISVLTWNICGAWDQCKSYTQPEKKIAEIKEKVRADSGLSVIMIQEACKSIHSDALAAALGDGWVVRHRTGKVIGTDQLIGCDASGGKPEAGTAIALRKLPGADIPTDATGQPGWDLTFRTKGLEHENGDPNRPVTDKQTQGAPCIEDRGNRLLVCTSHFANGSADPTGELRAVSAADFAQTSRDWQAGGYRTVLGGDLNLTPGSSKLDGLYAANFEADSNEKCNTTGPRPSLWLTCRNRFGKKLDYVFFSDKGWDLRGGDAVYNGSDDYEDRKLSDHWALSAAVKPTAQSHTGGRGR